MLKIAFVKPYTPVRVYTKKWCSLLFTFSYSFLTRCPKSPLTAENGEFFAKFAKSNLLKF
jgi:hypothetical protein